MSDNNDNPGSLTAQEWREQNRPEKFKKMSPEQIREIQRRRTVKDVKGWIILLIILISIYLYTKSIIKTILIGAVFYIIFMFAFMIWMGYSLINLARKNSKEKEVH